MLLLFFETSEHLFCNRCLVEGGIHQLCLCSMSRLNSLQIHSSWFQFILKEIKACLHDPAQSDLINARPQPLQPSHVPSLNPPVIIKLIKRQNKPITKSKGQLFHVYSNHNIQKCKEQFREFSNKKSRFKVYWALFTFTGREKFRFQYQATECKSIKVELNWEIVQCAALSGGLMFISIASSTGWIFK